jgi:predicted nucleic-acid-binding Zn-ribbon protein
VSSDRWGYFDGESYRFWPSIVKSADYYGFDRNDPVYKTRTPYEKGQKQCPSCGLHAAQDRNYPCDVQLARAADIEAEGYPATFCRRCSGAMPTRNDQVIPLCWFCTNPPQAHRSRIRNGAVYVDDGVGCVEKVPSWMAEWDGGRPMQEPKV